LRTGALPHLPALVIAVVMTAYWGRVMRLVYKERRRSGRDANFRPTEPVGKWLRIIWGPAVLTWIIHPYFAAFRRSLPEWASPIVRSDAAAWGAVVVAMAAFVGTLVCWKRMGKSWRMGIDPGEKTTLVVTGPYAYVRHPIYALSSTLMLATLVILPSPLMLAVGLAHLVLLQWEARREEKYLTLHHGELYRRYCSKVGGFVPRSWRPYCGATAGARGS
jgi:protein-S-isoprenylcysteine O-methyltransferase Ste14